MVLHHQFFHGVSIHASVKDATFGFIYLSDKKSVSIHASVKDATLDNP